MLTIRREQMRVLDEAIHRRLVREILEYLRASHRDALDRVPPDRARALVEAGLARCKVYRLRRMCDVVWFVAAMFEVSPHFDRQRTIRRILEAPSLDDEARVESVLSIASEDDWREAAAL